MGIFPKLAASAIVSTSSLRDPTSQGDITRGNGAQGSILAAHMLASAINFTLG